MKQQKPSDILPVMPVNTLESLPIPSVYTDTAGFIRYMNPKFKELFLDEKKDYKNPHLHDLLCIPSRDHKKEDCPLTSTDNLNEFTFRHPIQINDYNGKKTWVEYSLYPVKEDSRIGNFLTIVPVSAISMSGEDSFQTLKAKFRAFFESSPLAKFIIDNNLKVVDANKRAATSSATSNLINNSLLSYFPESGRETASELFQQAINSEVSSTKQFQYKHDEKVVYLEIFIHPHFVPGYHAIIINDISATERNRQRRDRYLATVGHELKNPIAVIKAYTQMLVSKAQKTGDESSVKYLKTIDNKTDVLTKLINDFVDELSIAAEKMVLSITNVDIRKLLTSMVEEYQKTYPDYIFNFSGLGTSLIKADPIRLQQVIGNLFSNSIKYSKPGTVIKISLKRSQHQVIISVEDSGPGIPSHELERIFEAFFRGKPVKPEKIHGLGLGLYISKEIISMHKGRIWIESEVGKGTKAYISLPI